MKTPRRKVRIASIPLLALAMIIVSCIAVITENGENGEKDYRKFRAEGLSLREAMPSALKYIRKYYHKSFDAPDSIRSYFTEQSDQIAIVKGQANHGEEVLSIAFVGDLMWIRNGWDSFLDEGLRVYLQQFDMVFGNLETMVDTTAPVPSLFPDYAKYNSEPGLIRSFRRDNGENIFTALSLANNHAYDLGASGLANTKAFLNGEGILSTGATAREMPAEKIKYKKEEKRGKDGRKRDGKESPALDELQPVSEKNFTIEEMQESDGKEYLVIERAGIKIGLYAASWGMNNPYVKSGMEFSINTIPGIAPLNRNEIDLTGLFRVLEKMKNEQIDFRILLLHWGYEYELYPDPAIMETGRKLAGAGADMVIGSHPHVIQPFEIWSSHFVSTELSADTRKSLIVYSQGNFTTAMYTPLNRLGSIISVNLFRDPHSGKTDWTLRETQYVYNKPPGRKPGGRKTMLFDDYLESLDLKYPGEARRLREKTRLVTEY